MKNIVLIGFMGCGKTSVGKRLAQTLGYEFLDTDTLIEQKEGKTISEIFASDGENAFRDMETACIRRLLEEKKEGFVLSVGGGLPLRECNRSLLKELGEVVFLRASSEVVYERLKNDRTRPLLQDKNPRGRIQDLMNSRKKLYLDAALQTVDVDNKDFDRIIDEILTVCGMEEKKNQQKKILVINGPNLNFLGIREPDLYGKQDYPYLVGMLKEEGQKRNCRIECFQSNHEGAIIDRIQEAYFDKTEGIIINPGAYTHYSYAIRDALSSIDVPKVEVHITDIQNREEFRKKSVTADVCDKQIFGKGLPGYVMAMDHLISGKD